MSNGIRVKHIFGGITAFAIGFATVTLATAVPAKEFAYATDGVIMPVVGLVNEEGKSARSWRSENIPMLSSPANGAVVGTIRPNEGGTISSCSADKRWCLMRADNGAEGWVDILNFAFFTPATRS